MTTIVFDRKTASPEELKKLAKGSALTMLGYLPEETHLYVETLRQFIKGDSVTVYETSAEALNETFDFTRKLPSGLNVFAIDLEELKDVAKLAVTVRFDYGFRWLDDIVSNSTETNEEAN
jgi:hypothetical protein